jgi:REP element-mobilizing transposase RayT
MKQTKPMIHQRHSIRLKGYDYSQSGLYFITICCQDRIYLFGEITNDEMATNEIGKIAKNCWTEIPQHFKNTVLHEYIIMPNHIHGIIEITGKKNAVEPVEALHATPQRPNQPDKNEFMSFVSPKSGTLSTIIRSYKSAVTKHAHQLMVDFAWQRNYYEHIIRNDESYYRIANYIIDNPKNWEKDKLI